MRKVYNLKTFVKKQSKIFDMYHHLKRSLMTKKKTVSKQQWFAKKKTNGLNRYMKLRGIKKKSLELRLLWIRALFEIEFKMLHSRKKTI